PTPEATETLIALAGHADKKFALEAARALTRRLPDSQWQSKQHRWKIIEDPQQDPRRYLVSRSWRHEFAPEVRGIARRLLLYPDGPSLECGGLILECVGEKDDLGALIKGVDWAVCQTRKATAWREVSRKLLEAVRVLDERGGAPPEQPQNPGEAIVF